MLLKIISNIFIMCNSIFFAIFGACYILNTMQRYREFL
nr:MAG TPA: hypothetical protein [Caudoviricetes sp.]